MKRFMKIISQTSQPPWMKDKKGPDSSGPSAPPAHAANTDTQPDQANGSSQPAVATPSPGPAVFGPSLPVQAGPVQAVLELSEAHLLAQRSSLAQDQLSAPPQKFQADATQPSLAAPVADVKKAEENQALHFLSAKPDEPIAVEPGDGGASWRVLSTLAARASAKNQAAEATEQAPAKFDMQRTERAAQMASYHSPRPAPAKPFSPSRPAFGFAANRSGQSAKGGYLGKNPRDTRQQTGRASGFGGMALSQAGAEFNALFSAKTDAPDQALFSPRVPPAPVTAIASALFAAGAVSDALQRPDVSVKRRKLTLKDQSFQEVGKSLSVLAEAVAVAVSGGAAASALDEPHKQQPKIIEDPWGQAYSAGAAQTTAPPENPFLSSPEGSTKRTFLVPARPANTPGLGFGAFSEPEPPAPAQPFDLDALALTVRKDQLPAGVFVVEQPVVDAALLSKRLKTLAPEQAAAWLLVTPEHNLKPLSHPVVRLMIQQLLAQLDDEALHALHPASFWVSDPFKDMAFHSDGQYRRVAQKQWPSSLPGQTGVWLGAHKLSSTESGKRSVNAQRIHEISLAGIVMASNRLEAMAWMLADRLDPLRAAARLGCAQGMENRGHEIGDISGYALALLAHASQFFSWCTQWQALLRERALGRTNELSSALALAIKTWSSAHGELAQDCAEMTAVMLQLGASLSEWGLLAFSPHGRKDAGPAVAWARFCAQTFGIDRHGQAVQRVIDSARIHGFALRPVSGEAQPMMAFAQANLHEAVAIFLRAGFDPYLTDALGQTAMSRANSGRADLVVSLLLEHAQRAGHEEHGEAPKLRPEQGEALGDDELVAYSLAAVQEPQEPQETSEMPSFTGALLGPVLGEPASLQDTQQEPVQPPAQAEPVRAQTQGVLPLFEGVLEQPLTEASLARTAQAAAAVDAIDVVGELPGADEPTAGALPALSPPALESPKKSQPEQARVAQAAQRTPNPLAEPAAQQDHQERSARAPMSALLAEQARLKSLITEMVLVAGQFEKMDRALLDKTALVGLAGAVFFDAVSPPAKMLRPLESLLAEQARLKRLIADMALAARDVKDLDRLMGVVNVVGVVGVVGVVDGSKEQNDQIVFEPVRESKPSLAELLAQKELLQSHITAMESAAEDALAMDRLLGSTQSPGIPRPPLSSLHDEQTRLQLFIDAMTTIAEDMRQMDPMLVLVRPGGTKTANTTTEVVKTASTNKTAYMA